jgi:hypothetical protein
MRLNSLSSQKFLLCIHLVIFKGKCNRKTKVFLLLFYFLGFSKQQTLIVDSKVNQVARLKKKPSKRKASTNIPQNHSVSTLKLLNSLGYSPVPGCGLVLVAGLGPESRLEYSPVLGCGLVHFAALGPESIGVRCFVVDPRFVDLIFGGDALVAYFPCRVVVCLG